MKIAVLFDGAGLARLGLERAGHECTGYEIDPAKHHLSKMVGSGNCILGDVRDFDYSGYDAIWASPPCQERSSANFISNNERKDLYNDLLDFSLNLTNPVLWVENVLSFDESNKWGRVWNAAQFTATPLQNRNRIIGGRYNDPFIYRSYDKSYDNVCPAITASEYQGHANDWRRASRWYGRKLSVRECAHHQGFEIPHQLLKSWYYIPDMINPKTCKPYTESQWRKNIYEGIGNGVPCYMAYMFGLVYSDKTTDYYGNELPLKQAALF